MNDQSGGFPQNGAVAPFSNAGLPSMAMRDMVVAARAKQNSPINPSEIWRVIRKWWWLIAGIVLACLLAAIALSLLVTPEYRARTTVEINREGVQPVQMGNIQTPSSAFFQDRDFINTQAGLLRSRALARSEKTNRRLTLVATVFLPLSFFVGLFGINVGGMPWANLAGHRFGFWIIAGLCVAIALAILWLFRRLRWL